MMHQDEKDQVSGTAETKHCITAEYTETVTT